MDSSWTHIIYMWKSNHGEGQNVPMSSFGIVNHPNIGIHSCNFIAGLKGLFPKSGNYAPKTYP